jgi:hypothetical protein
LLEDDMERLKLQRENEEKDRLIREWKNKTLSSEEKYKTLNDKYNEALVMMEELNISLTEVIILSKH